MNHFSCKELLLTNTCDRVVVQRLNVPVGEQGFPFLLKQALMLVAKRQFVTILYSLWESTDESMEYSDMLIDLLQGSVLFVYCVCG